MSTVYLNPIMIGVNMSSHLFAIDQGGQTGIIGDTSLGIYVADLPEGVDCTTTLQLQITNLSDNGGGTLIIPRGKYTINGSITVNKGVRLEGVINANQSWDIPIDNHVIPHKGIIPGTVILATGGHGDPSASPLFKLESGTSISGISIYYPNQVRNAQTFVEYPWSVYIAGNDCTVENITLYNSYQGIRAGERKLDPLGGVIMTNSERHRIRNVLGTVLSVGIWVDRCTDVGRIENIHFQPEIWGCMDGNGWTDGEYEIVQEIMQNNLVAFKFGETDWEFVTDTFVWCADIGYHFVKSIGPIGGEHLTMSGQLSGVACDKVCTGFKIDYLEETGFVATNVQCAAVGEKTVGTSAKTAIKIESTCEGNIRFANSNFWGPIKKSAVSEGSGFLALSNCFFRNPSEPGPGELLNPVIISSGGRLQVSGCSFMTHSLRKHVRLNQGTESAILYGNNAKNTDIGSGFRRENNIGTLLIEGLNE